MDNDTFLQTNRKIYNLLKGWTPEEIGWIQVINKAWQEKEAQLRKRIIAQYSGKTSQIEMCLAWLLLFEHRALNRLIERFQSITKAEFHVLMAAFVMLRMGRNFFTVSDLRKYLLDWQHTRIYKHLRKLMEYDMITKKEPISEKYKHGKYSITEYGIKVIHAFNQYYIDCYSEFQEGFGNLPNDFNYRW